MRLLDIVQTSNAVGATRKRGEKVALLERCVARLAPEEAAAGTSFLAGTLRQGRIGVGPAAVRATRLVPAAGESRLQIIEVDAALARVAGLQGAGSGKARGEALEALMGRATAQEQDFLRRLLLGELRQGALESLVVDALARASGIALATVRRARMLAGELAPVAESALREGEAGLSRFKLTLFQPIEPMLAGAADDVDEALARLGRAAFELKLDGARVQVHRRDDEVRVFSRQLHDVTAAVPEVVQAARALPVRECVLDGEAIALDPERRPLPFQVTMRRFGRRADVDALRERIPLGVFFFDCLVLDGIALIDRPEAERSAALARILPEANRTPRMETADARDAQSFFDQAIENGHEGVMAKSLEATYEAGRRGSGWLKLKQAHTLDLLVIAAEWGSGRRRGWLSNLHLAARDPGGGPPVMLGKTFKGLTDATLEWQTAELLARETVRDGQVVHVRPELVVEIAFNDVQRSPHYPAGMALRFARVKRYRDDKRPADADTVDTVRRLAPW